MKPTTIRISDDGVEINGTLLHDRMSIDSLASVLGSSPSFVSPPELDPPTSSGVVAPVYYRWDAAGVTIKGTRDGQARAVVILLPDPGWVEGTFGGDLEVFGVTKQPEESGVSYVRRLLDSSQAGFLLSSQDSARITETNVLRYERTNASCKNMNIYISNPKNPPSTHNNGLIEYLMWRDVEKPIHLGSKAQDAASRPADVGGSVSSPLPATASTMESRPANVGGSLSTAPATISHPNAFTWGMGTEFGKIAARAIVRSLPAILTMLLLLVLWAYLSR